MLKGIEVHQYSPNGWQAMEGHSPQVPNLTFIVKDEDSHKVSFGFDTDLEVGVTVVLLKTILNFQTSAGIFKREMAVVADILNTGDSYYVGCNYLSDSQPTTKYPPVYRITQT